MEKCPNLVVVQGDYGWYEELSNRFFKYLRRFSSLIEPASIDECYMDVTDVIKDYKRPLDLAWQIQKSVQKDLKLPCSIGVAPNKFLAKMASDMRKPMGITILRKQEVPKKLWPLPISDMWGIGKKTVPLLILSLIHISMRKRIRKENGTVSASLTRKPENPWRSFRRDIKAGVRSCPVH